MKTSECIYIPSRTSRDFLHTLPGRYVFFDIETTGLSSKNSTVYLIGVTWPVSYENPDREWNFCQWFADTRESEREVLREFTLCLAGFDTLVHFNGDTFDIPFVRGRLFYHRMSDPFSLITSVDLYRMARPLKKMLPIGSLKLKSLESFLGIHRDDPYTGGELIDVYNQYLKCPTWEAEKDLMLHNEEDIKGMPELLPIFAYLDMKKASYRLVGQKRERYSGFDGTEKTEICLTFESSLALPAAYTQRGEDVKLHVDGNIFTFFFTPYVGALRHYFPNYRDYFYLTMEDKIVHKSIGQFVDKAVRRKARPEECYVEKEGLFLPQKEPLITPVFQKEGKGREWFFLLEEELKWDEETATRFVQGWL